MAEEDSRRRPERRPIKLVLPKQGTERKIQAGGAAPKPFRTVDADYRRRLSNQVSAIRQALVPQLRRTGAAALRVKLVSKAVAKSHRPEQLFSQSSCPIIGGGSLGEVFVKATPEGLDRLTTIIETFTTDRVMNEGQFSGPRQLGVQRYEALDGANNVGTKR